MERDEVIREDFPTARKGWDPDAVRAHLQSLAERLPSPAESVGTTAGKRVEGIVAAAEQTATEIEEEARRRAADLSAEAEELLDEARSQAERIVADARREAGGRVEQAQAAVESLVSQAEDLRTRVGSLGESLAGEARERVSDGSEAGGAGAAQPAAEPEPQSEP
ncbi:MAG TPA: hypothetical protein VKA36_00590, partial [Solirubrobacterales bacterium]|nr:hypothetical protein [Solirubrobacterales bacterium]